MAILMISSIAAAILDFFNWEGASPTSTFGYDGHRVQIYVSITNTEWVISILML